MQRFARRFALPRTCALLATQYNPRHTPIRLISNSADLGIIDGVTINNDDTLGYKGIRCDIKDNTLPGLDGYAISGCVALFLFLCFYFHVATRLVALISGKEAIAIIGHKAWPRDEKKGAK